MTTKTARIFNILAIDDDADVLKSLEASAREHYLRLTSVNSLEGAQKLINEGNSFQGFIFDVVCNTYTDQTNPKEDFISKALDYAKKNFQAYPRAIITGYSNHYEGLSKYYSEEKIFEKGNVPAITEMFKWFRKEIENLKETKIKEKYPEVWEVFNLKLLSYEIEKELLETLMQIDNWQKPNNVRDNAARVRGIFESLYGSLAKNTLLIPKNYKSEDKNEEIILIDRENLKIREIIKYLAKNKELSPAQADTARFIWSMASEIIHEGVNKPLATQYTNRALVYGLCDAILWFKSKREEHEIKEKKLYRSLSGI